MDILAVLVLQMYPEFFNDFYVLYLMYIGVNSCESCLFETASKP